MATNWKPNSTKTSGSKGGGTSDGGTIPIIPTTGGGTLDNPNWYIPKNVTAPPGVDPYYGVSIYGLGDNAVSTSGGTNSTSPSTTSGLGGSKGSNPGPTDLGDLTGSFTPWDDPGYRNYLNNWGVYEYYGGGSIPEGAMSYQQWKALNGSTNTSTGNGGNSGSNSFKIARPNMTWENSLPSVIPGNGQEALNSYAPIPFTREANTPGASYIKPPLTYNNPYNTNPYLPTANPFALIANQSQAS